ncbi:hypothetical protein NBRC111452_1264 [Companilactobacillus farciminis]|nr:hypothetical protein NBRC111452_1264 [Companilactobacillus farciminis]
MNEIIRIIIYSLGGAIVGGFFNVWLQRVKNQGGNEKVYAEYSEDMFQRTKKAMDERDDLKEQVIELRAQISEQSKTIKKQSKVIDGLTAEVEKLSTQFKSMEDKNEK